MDTLISWNEIILQIWKKAKAKKENQFKYIRYTVMNLNLKWRKMLPAEK